MRDFPPRGPAARRAPVPSRTSNSSSTATDALDATRAAVESGVSGVIVGGALVPELTHLDTGFFACPGATSEVVHEHRGRLGLPPTFLHHRQESTLEIETGAELHVRLLLAEADLPLATMGERLVTADTVVKGRSKAADVHAELAASWPGGASWPPAPEVAADHIRVRRIRRLAAVLLFVAGAIDLLSSVTTPLREHLHLIAQYLPVAVVQAAGALTAIAGIGMIMLSRGVLRGQRRSWLVAVLLLIASLALHLLHAADIITLVVCAGVLTLLIVERERFRAQAERGTVVTAFVIIAVGGVIATLGGFLAVEVAGHVHHHPLPGWPDVLLGSAERLVGVDWVAFPPTIDRYASVSLLAVGISLIVVALYLLTRPVVDRRLSSGRAAIGRRAAEIRARDIVRRHGTGTLDYFALRDDKQWFFHRDSLVAYAVFGGVCLVSPDPIGPFSERAHVWDSFRNYVDRNGWGLGVMGAGEEWLPTYQASGMRFLYIGDEAVVDPREFSLQGGKMKGLRQAVNRVARYGYTVRFLDPARLQPEDAARMAELMAKSRRGEQERGFSMMLGRLFDRRDTGLLLTLVEGPDGAPVAMCQFVPSPAIDGYSLDLMRRDPGEHPNGLLDFALCSTIDHLKEMGMKGLSLNFAAFRSVLEGDNGDGVTQRVERWALRRLSGVLQIETLWRFNAKYEPRWLPRYIVFDSAEQFVPVVVQIMRAESLTEMPVIGRLLTTGTAKRSGPAVPEEVLAAQQHLGDGDGDGRLARHGQRKQPAIAPPQGQRRKRLRPRSRDHERVALPALGIPVCTTAGATTGPARTATAAGPTNNDASARHTTSHSEVRHDTTMTVAEREAFLAGLHVGILSVDDPGRGPLSVPVWYAYEPGGMINVVTAGQSVKAQRLRPRGGSPSVCRPRPTPIATSAWRGRSRPWTRRSPRRATGAGPALSRRRRRRPLHRRHGGPAAGSVAFRMTPEHWRTSDYGKAN